MNSLTLKSQQLIKNRNCEEINHFNSIEKFNYEKYYFKTENIIILSSWIKLKTKTDSYSVVCISHRSSNFL